MVIYILFPLNEKRTKYRWVIWLFNYTMFRDRWQLIDSIKVQHNAFQTRSRKWNANDCMCQFKASLAGDVLSRLCSWSWKHYRENFRKKICHQEPVCEGCVWTGHCLVLSSLGMNYSGKCSDRYLGWRKDMVSPRIIKHILFCRGFPVSLVQQATHSARLPMRACSCWRSLLAGGRTEEGLSPFPEEYPGKEEMGLEHPTVGSMACWGSLHYAACGESHMCDTHTSYHHHTNLEHAYHIEMYHMTHTTCI
jgi:hypothetical protein